MSEPTKKVHFIAIGGSAMHNLALAMQEKGFDITGSDDEIFEPSRTRLEKASLLPESMGWFPEKIHLGLESVILGMHARSDNPELLKAKELGLRIYSYPEYIYRQSLEKQRIVIAGSHGKTTITGIILHVLMYFRRDFDYMVGAQLEGFDKMVRLSDDAPIIVIEGDEYLTSPIDLTPKFLHYHHHIGLISGVAWDHINVFPTFEEYVRQFDSFADATPKSGILIYCDHDPVASVIGSKEREEVQRIEYSAHKNEIIEGTTYLVYGHKKIPVKIFGKHNMKNISGAKAVLNKIGISDDMFYEAVRTFKGAANRLEILSKGMDNIVFKDFAHAPSKLKATTNAVKKQYVDRKLVAVLELHTFSSLNKNFLNQYKDTFKAADTPIVYYNPHTIQHKKLEEISEKDVMEAFNNPKLKVFTKSESLRQFLFDHDWKKTNLLLMSSGNFDGINLRELADNIVRPAVNN